MDAFEQFGAIDYQRLVDRWGELHVWNGAFEHVGRPAIEVKFGKAKTMRVTGFCQQDVEDPSASPTKPLARAFIRLYIHPTARLADVLQSVLHEMTHAAGWMDHSHRFYNTLREAVFEAFGLDVEGQQREGKYEYDREQRERLHALLGDCVPSYVPVLAKPRRTQKPPTVPVVTDVQIIYPDLSIEDENAALEAE